MMDEQIWKKGQLYEGVVEYVKFPNKGVVRVKGIAGKCSVKNTVAGQHISFVISKKRGVDAEGRLVDVIKRADYEIESNCPHSEVCGGCSYRNLPYEEQLRIKDGQVKTLLKDLVDESCFEPIKASPIQEGYRNKMEFSFGDGCKDGPLEIGLHKKGSFYDIETVTGCRIVDEDYRKILACTLAFFRQTNIPFFHKLRHEGILRHLLVRKAAKTGEILIDLITVSENSGFPGTEQYSELKDSIGNYVNQLLGLDLDGKIVGILHTANDALSDAIRNDGTDILFGQDFFYEELLGLQFKITPFSFFQTNSLSAEVLYDTVRSLVTDTQLLNNSVIYDLYSGTGTIAQLLAPVAQKVIGVEIIEEAVEAAKMNAEVNGLHNCDFIAGDVLKVLDTIEEKPDFIVLDPPRDGIHPKALTKIIDYGVQNIVYISCKPTSLARDLPEFLRAGYEVKKVCPVDQFPCTVHVETVCLLSRK